METIVKSVIEQWDPMGFLARGQQDPYKGESYRIASCIVEGTTEEMLGSIIKNVFMESYDQDLGTVKCEEIAAQILDQTDL